MVGSGESGARFVVSTLFVVSVFMACGGSSERQGGDVSPDDGLTGGSAPKGGSSSGGSAARGGASGASSGGVSGDGSFGGFGADIGRGGSGAADPIDPPGPQFCGGQPCDAPRACCLATGKCFDPGTDPDACATPDPDDDPQGRKPCASSAQCGANEFCMMDGFLCAGTGHCQPIDNCGFCSSGADDSVCRVCGCDGNTYPNVQTACRAGVNVPGASGSGCGETGMEGGGGSSSGGPRSFMPCGHDGQCPSGQFCCSLVARCYAEADRDICVAPPPGARIACKTNDHCNGYEYCQGDGCTGPGGCVAFGSQEECGVTLEPVCGCDGTTYTSAACAAMRGTRFEHQGECDAAGG